MRILCFWTWRNLLNCLQVRNKDSQVNVKVSFLDFKLSSCVKCNMFSFGCFPGACVLIAEVSEHSIGSIFKGRSMKFLCFLAFLTPYDIFLDFGDWFVIYCFLFYYLFVLLSLLVCWFNLGYIFGCDLISYGIILLSLWICVLMVLARESVFRLGYFSRFYLLLWD
jgi:hypothetical protein